MKKWTAVVLIVLMWASFFIGNDVLNAITALIVTAYLIGGDKLWQK